MKIACHGKVECSPTSGEQLHIMHAAHGLLHGPVLHLAVSGDVLGAGVGGTVLRGEVVEVAPGSDTAPGTPVALKRACPFEVFMWGVVRSRLRPFPGLATPLQATRDRFLVTVDGGHGTLAGLLSGRLAALSVGRAPGVYATMARDLLEAVRALAGVGICHNDLKPENVLVRETDPKPRLALVDLGAAVLVEPCGCCSGPHTRPRPRGEPGPVGFVPGFPRSFASGEAPLWPGEGFSGVAAAAWGVGMLLACALAGERDVILPGVGVPPGECDPWDTGAARVKARMAAYLRSSDPGVDPVDAAQAGVLCLWPTIGAKWVADTTAPGPVGALAHAHTLGAVGLTARLLLAGVTPGPQPCPLSVAANDPWLTKCID